MKKISRLAILMLPLLIINPRNLLAGDKKVADQVKANFFECPYFLNNSTFQEQDFGSDHPTQTGKAPGKAFLKSLFVPGWGELSAGRTERARNFLLAEGVLWSGFAALQVYSLFKRNDLEIFAIEHAGVNSRGKDKAFYTDMSNYFDIYEYNEEKRRFRQYDKVYPVDDDHFWRWQNEEDFRRFDRLHNSSELALRNATLMVGGVLINHVFSAIDAVWVTRQYNKQFSSTMRVLPTLNERGEVVMQVSFSASW